MINNSFSILTRYHFCCPTFCILSLWLVKVHERVQRTCGKPRFLLVLPKYFFAFKSHGCVSGDHKCMCASMTSIVTISTVGNNRQK